MAVKRILFVFILLSITAVAQVWDSSGNGMLSGNYLFRQVAYQTNELGSVPVGVSLIGFLVFDGQGNYSINGSLFDTRLPSLVQYSRFGTYSISSSGYGFLEQPLGPGRAPLHVLISNGIFVGSTPDGVDGLNDFMMAVPAGSGTNATFNGTYSMAYMNFPGSFATAYDAVAELSPDGFGNIGTVTATSYRGLDETPLQVSLQGVSYGFNGGVGFLNFPPSPVIGGAKTMFISPNGNLIFGGSASGYDFFVAVREAPVPPALSGLYYQGGIHQDNSNQTFGVLSTFHGSFKAVDGVILGHRRFLSSFIDAPRNITYTESYPTSPALTHYTHESGKRRYVVSSDGTVRIGLGLPPFLGIEVAVKKPPLSGLNIFLDPTGVVNAASYAPFTSGVAPGELLVLYGINLANSTVVTPPGVAFPFMLDGVQVLINGRPSPLYYISPGQIAVVVPYGTVESIAEIKIVKNGQASNTVTAFVYESAPGVFSLTNNGIGSGAVLHADFSVVTAARPARPGEIVLVFLTGLGDVSPSIPEGAPGRVSPLNQTVTMATATINGIPAEVLYSGLAPTLSGLYQLNVKVPETAGTGNLLLGVGGPGSFTAQVTIPVSAP